MNGEIECSTMCRGCMKVDGVLLPMYGDDLISKKNLPNKLSDLASIHIDKYDGLPNVLCPKCAYRTDAFYEFKLQVQATEKKLRKMFQYSSFQNHCLKAEIVRRDSKSNEHVDADDCPSDESHPTSIGYQSPCEASQERRENIESDVKPAVEYGQNSDEYIVDSHEPYIETESIHFSDVPMNENVKLSASQSLDHIFVSHMDNMIGEQCCELQGVKNEASDDTNGMLESDDLNYSLLYSPVDDDANVEEPNETPRIIHPVDRSESSCNDKTLFDDKETMENVDSTERSTKPVSWNAEPSCTRNKSTRNIGKSTTNSSFNAIENNTDESTKNSCTNEKSITHSKTNNDDDSESDYFVDPLNSLLGSLNDTIMRIKEIKLNNGTKVYQCNLCMQNYDELPGVLIHTVDTHVPTSGPFYCVICEKDCESHRDLRTHVKTHSGRSPYSCFICNKAYSMKRYLKRHMSCHTDFPRHRCPKCGSRFNLKTELDAHVRTHVAEGALFACSQCPRAFNHKGNYRRHLMSHLDPRGMHLPKYPCEVCGKRFSNNRMLTTHMRVHTGEKPYHCDVCGRSFSQQGNLLNHLRIHRNPRSYTCEVCGKRFNQRATLRDHSLLHTGEKPWVCTVCGMNFTFSAALRRHMWTHADDKPFGCEMCDARFVGTYDMKRHMKTHTQSPRIKRSRNRSHNDRSDRCENLTNDGSQESEISANVRDDVFVDDVVVVVQNSGQSAPREEAEKENVDALFNLIQFG